MNESKSINIFTKSIQTDAEGTKNNIEFFVEGSYVEKGKSKYITYKESEVSGMEGTTTTIKIDADSLSIIRFGNITSKLEFKQGEVTNSIYATPYGQFEITIETKLLEINLNLDQKSTIKLEYSMQANAEEAMNNEMIISFS